MEKLNFALIGCGRISRKHIEALNNNRDSINTFAICDIKQEAMDECEKMLNNPIQYIDYKELLANREIDVVIIGTPSGNHYEIAMDSIRAGKHMIVEKPMAMNEKQCGEMIKAAKMNHVKLGVCHQNRFNPSILALKKAIDAGRFGRIYAANARILWQRDKSYYDAADWRGTYEQDGGCLMNQCIHNIDILLWIMDSRISHVHFTLANYFHPYIEMEDYGSIQVCFENGAIGNIEGTVNVAGGNLYESLTVLGEKGTVEIGGQAINLIHAWRFDDQLDVLEDVQKTSNLEIKDIYGGGHTALFRDFANAVTQNATPAVDGREGVKAVRLISEIYQSVGKRIDYNTSPVTGYIPYGAR